MDAEGSQSGSSVKRSPLDRAFERLDVDHSGHIDHADIEAVIGRMLAHFGESPASPRGRAVMDGFGGLWEALLRAVDTDGDRRISRDELRVHRRFEAASITNDVFVAMWFVVGSVLFFFEETVFLATCLFLLGSMQFMIRPVLRMRRHVQMRRARAGARPSADPAVSPATDM